MQQQQQQQQEQEQEQEQEGQEEEEEEEEAAAAEEDAQKCNKKMRGGMRTSRGMTTTSHCALHLRTSGAHEQHRRPHYHT